MIYLPEEESARNDPSAGGGRLLREDMLAQADRAFDGLALAEASRGVIEFAAERAVSGRRIVCLRPAMIRALASVGRIELAGRLYMAGTGIAKLIRLAAFGTDPVWVVDFGMAGRDAAAGFDLMLFRSAELVLNSLAAMWDESDGRGALGLKGLRIAVARDSKSRSGRKRSDVLFSEVKSLCRGKLEAFQLRRGWRFCPALLDMG